MCILRTIPLKRQEEIKDTTVETKPGLNER